jgi:uncharacterized membrane protein
MRKENVILYIVGILLFIVLFGSISNSDFEDEKNEFIYQSQIQGIEIDLDENGIHDSICECGMCLDTE